MTKEQKLQGKKNIVSFIPTGDYYYNKGLQALQRDQFDKAHKYIQRAVELSPNDPLILMQFGIIQMELNNFEHALELFKSANSLDPNEADIVFFLSEIHAHLGMLREAQIYASKYLEMDVDGPYHEEALELMDFISTEFDIESIEDSRDGEMLYLQEKARSIMEKGNFQKAVEILEAAIEKYPEFWAAYNNLALAYFYLGEEEQAKALLHSVLRQDKGNLHALCNLAVFYYYEKDEEKLTNMVALLSKIQPYLIEHRYKLGATFALIGKHEEAFKWLRSLQKKGFEGDTGFFFWLAHAAYFTGHEQLAKTTWKQLTDIDPSKEGLEPWKGINSEDAPSIEHDRNFIIEKLNHSYSSERLFGIYLLSKSEHKQEIVSHPKWINVDQLTTSEKMFLAYSLGHRFSQNDKSLIQYTRAIETTEKLYEKYSPINKTESHLYQMWFVLCERGLEKEYKFKNPTALAAATDYMFRSSRYSDITKKSVADEYDVSVPTLTKYVNELMQFLPMYD